MIIKEILLENFMCYYDENTFELSNGLNIILGHNGDGKTTLFTAFKWIFDPLFNLSTKDIYSLKKFSETSIGDSFETKVGIKVEQYNQIYTIEKAFEITNKSGIAKLSSINNTIFILDLETGESSYCDEDIKVVLNRVFPTDFRNFSMFETEAETLDLVKGKPLYKLVQLFSNARFYENLEQIANKISSKARKAYISESKADEETKRKLDNFDTKILESEVEIKRLDKRISEDDNGLRDIQEVFDEYARNSNLSDEINRVNKTIQDQEEKKQSLQRAVKNKYTDYLFDNSYILVGFPKIHSEFSEKVDKLRQERNRIEEEFLAASVEEEYKLTLANGTTPLPPGSPTETILNEFLRDGICKICNRQLDQNSIDFMNKSLELKNKSLVKGPIKRPKFFHNSFIKDLELHDDKLNNIHDSQNDIHNYESDIDKLVELNVRLEADIKECNILIDSLEKERKDILFRAPSSLSEDKLMALTAHISQLSDEKAKLTSRIDRNKILLSNEKETLEDLIASRKRTKAQTQEGSFKLKTTEILDDISEVFKVTKEREYNKFLHILEQKSTDFLKRINPGEVTGLIKLEKSGDEVNHFSVDEDGSPRADLKNSGALKISIPMSILFAISDLASEIRKDDHYPMIFDAPTGRFSEDRELEFFNALHESGRQKIIVTLRFLGVKDDGKIYIKDEFARVPKDKAFWILRDRPLTDSPDSINTNIINL